MNDNEGLGGHNAIWDDGEWISWDEINHQLAAQEFGDTPDYEIDDDPEGDREDLARVFEDLLMAAQEYHDLTGRYLQIWGELGEFYAEIKYGIKRHRPHVPGSDGRMGDDFVEVKTISPEKGDNRVQVKRAGNFNKLLIVKISKDWSFETRLIDRKTLGKGEGRHARVNWNTQAGSSESG
mgnify:CR=1 FL=1